MTTIYLRFADRATACATLESVLGFDGAQGEDGRQLYSSGLHETTRYHLCFLADAGVRTGGGEDHVNLLWPDGAAPVPDFGLAAIGPLTPSCMFGPQG